jgi:DNA anti-recombination protein RmuC
MLADDDIDDCQFFKDALETLPITTRLKTVNDGVQLMNHLQENAAQLPDILSLNKVY